MAGRRRTATAAGIAVALAVGLSASVAAAAAGWRVVGHGGGGGYRASASATAALGSPAAVAVRVRSTPSQGTTGRWSLACSNVFARGAHGERFEGTTPLVVRVPQARVSGSCAATVTASIGSGALTVEILAR
jgi:hypothetical protein